MHIMYGFLDQHLTIHDELQDKFQATLERKIFNNSENPYILINLPIEKKNLIINNKRMVTLDHHFTIPKKEDNKSNYHYTLVLQDLDTHIEYKTHLFLDNLDRITLEPKLFSDDEHFIPIKNASMKEICSYSLSSTGVILFIRDAQKKAITSLITEIDLAEIELINLSKDIAKNKEYYIEKIKNQIELLRFLESMGSNFRKNEIKFYTTLLQMINEKPIKKIQIIENPVKRTPLRKNNPLKEINLLHETSISETVPAKKRRQRRINKSNIQSNVNLINACKESIMVFDQSRDPEMIEDMINKVVELRSIYLFSAHPNPELFEITIELKTRICDYFKDNNICNYLYPLAVNAQIIPLSDVFLVEILKKDDVNTLKMVLNFNLIANSTNIISECNNTFTLVEACVHYNATKCFSSLLDNKFSMDFINEENSPFITLLDNPSKRIKFVNISNLDTLEKLNNRILSMLEKRAKSTLGEATLISLKMEQIEVTQKIFELYKKDKRYKFLLEEKDVTGLHPDIINTLQNHIEYQEALLRYTKANYESLQIIPVSGLLSKNRECKSSPENLQKAMIELNSMPLDAAIKKIIAELNMLTDAMQLYCNLQSGIFRLSLKTNNSKPHTIIETDESDTNNILNSFKSLSISENKEKSVITPMKENTKKMNTPRNKK